MNPKRQVSAARAAASRQSGRKSKGPKTPQGKARSSLNSIKTGAYAKTDNALREIMLRRGENPADYEELNREMAEAWQPEDVMEAMLVKSIAEKSFDKAQLRADWMESQLASLRLAQIRARQRQHLASRWCPGVSDSGRVTAGLWRAEDSASKFQQIFDGLDLLEKWCAERDFPDDEYAEVVSALYGECPSKAGQRILELFADVFNSDEEEAPPAEQAPPPEEAGEISEQDEKALQELSKWIAQERADVEQERDLHRQEVTLRRSAARSTLTDEQVISKEALLEKQIAAQTRVLLQLKTKRSQWASPVGAAETSLTAAAANREPAAAGVGGPATSPTGENAPRVPGKPPTADASVVERGDTGTLACVAGASTEDEAGVEGAGTAKKTEKAETNLVSAV